MAGPGCSSGWGLLQIQKLTHRVTVTAAAWSAMLQFLQVVCVCVCVFEGSLDVLQGLVVCRGVQKTLRGPRHAAAAA